MADVDIYIVGLGMVEYAQVTREVENALERASEIYSVHDRRLVEEYLETFGADVVPVWSEYEKGRDRVEIYERIADRVLEGAKSNTEPVALAVYGHPFVAVSPSKRVVERAREAGLEVTVMPGISSLDNLYVDLELDPVTSGLQVFEATGFLAQETKPNPEVPLFLFQIGLLGIEQYSEPDPSAQQLDALGRHLSKYYSETHEARLVKTATYPISDPENRRIPLYEFESIADIVETAHTLFVPPV